VQQNPIQCCLRFTALPGFQSGRCGAAPRSVLLQSSLEPVPSCQQAFFQAVKYQAGDNANIGLSHPIQLLTKSSPLLLRAAPVFRFARCFFAR
jgi:hypothetical protein